MECSLSYYFNLIAHILSLSIHSSGAKHHMRKSLLLNSARLDVWHITMCMFLSCECNPTSRLQLQTQPNLHLLSNTKTHQLQMSNLHIKVKFVYFYLQVEITTNQIALKQEILYAGVKIKPVTFWNTSPFLTDCGQHSLAPLSYASNGGPARLRLLAPRRQQNPVVVRGKKLTALPGTSQVFSSSISLTKKSCRVEQVIGSENILSHGKHSFSPLRPATYSGHESSFIHGFLPFAMELTQDMATKRSLSYM